MAKCPARSKLKHRQSVKFPGVGIMIAVAVRKAANVQCVKIFLKSVPRFSSVSRHGAAFKICGQSRYREYLLPNFLVG
jgi:hypothetical protein